MARIIMTSNQKGGVGKTTLTLELCAMYASNKKKVLAIDLDGQGNLSLYTKSNKKDVPTIRDILLKVKQLSLDPDSCDDDDDIFNLAIQKTEDGFDIIASDKKLSEAQADFGDVTDVYLLQDLISLYKEDYDYIFIDCAPARSPLLYMAYFVSNYCLIVTESDLGSLDGVKQVHTDISLLHQRNMTNVKILGILLNKNEDTKEQLTAYMKLCNLGQSIGSMPFDTTIYKGIAVTESKNNYMSVRRYMEQGDRSTKKKTKPLVEMFDQLGEEIDERIKVMEG